MKQMVLMICLLARIAASCQDESYGKIRQCIFDSKAFPDLKSPQAVLITALFVKDRSGVYAFREKGPHHLNQLVIEESDICNVIPKDSSSNFVLAQVSNFASRNHLRKKDQKKLENKVREYILDFKESNYLK